MLGQIDKWTDTIPIHRRCSTYYAGSVNGKSLELEQPQYFVDGSGTLQGKKGR